MSNQYHEAAAMAERDDAYRQIEEAQDTIERLVAEKVGITRQRDELKRQLEIALKEIQTLRNQ